MTLRIAIQMDPIGSINPLTDTTLLLMREAQARGHTLFYYTPDKLSWQEGAIVAEAQPIKLFADPKHYFELGKFTLLDLKTVDVVLLRQDPPFNMAYITTTYLLEQLQGKTLVVNNPGSVRNLPEKIFPTLLPQYMPPTLITADKNRIHDFLNAHGDIVVKPLYGYGGRSVLRLKKNEGDFSNAMEIVFAGSGEPIVAQGFLPEVATEDKRIIMINGKVSAVVGRIPAEGEIRANLRVGGTPVKATLSKKQSEICAALSPLLVKHGLLLAGIDVIGDWLTEVNLTSPTTLVAANALYGTKLEAEFWDAVEAKL